MPRRSSRVAFLSVWLVSTVAIAQDLEISLRAPKDLQVTESAGIGEPFESVSQLQSARLGTDRQGNLWSWDREESIVEVFAVTGDRVSRIEVLPLRSLDVDRSWGVIGTSSDGSSLQVHRTDGRSRTIPLLNSAAHVTWIDQETVAITTTRSADSIEIWDIERETLVRSFAHKEEIVPRIGAVMLRSLVLRYSAQQDTLLALDSVTGDLEVWTLDGERVRSASVPAGRKAEIEDWLEDFDRQAKDRGQRHTPFYEVLRLALDPDGSAWVVTRCSPTKERASLTKVSGELPQTVTLDLPRPCCSNNFTIWNDHFVSAYPKRSDLPGCFVWRRFP